MKTNKLAAILSTLKQDSQGIVVTIFFHNTILAFLAFSSWFLAGLGPALALLPASYRREGFLLAPLMGMCLIALIGLFQITVLLMPLSPRFNLYGLIFISLLLCIGVWYTSQSKPNKSVSRFHSYGLLLAPLLLLFSFSWLFHNGGYQLILGSSDQLQYSLDARQIVEEMHTQSPNDKPIVRYDHVVYDIGTHIVPYLKGVRRGADVTLATTARVLNLNYEETFSLVVLSSLLALGFALGFLGRFFFNLLLWENILLQTTFLSSFYLLSAHIQGSLGLILGIAPNLMALAFMTLVIQESSWRWVVITAIMSAAYFSIYSEPALVNLVLPSLLMFLWKFWRSGSDIFNTSKRLTVLLLLIAVSAPYGLYSLVDNAFGNSKIIIFHHLQSIEVTKSIGVLFNSIELWIHEWSVGGVMLGLTTYFDNSAFNSKIAILLANAPWLGLVGVLIFWCSGLLGYIKIKNLLAAGFAIPLIIWILVSLTLGFEHDGLRFPRSLQYLMPFSIIGTVLLVIKSNLRHSGWSVFTWFGRVIIGSFIIMNLQTSARTINYLTKYDVTNDLIALRFDEKNTQWSLLRGELKLSANHNLPILISSFQDTVRPLAIVSDIGDQQHVLGSSMLKFWHVYKCYDRKPNLEWSDFNTRLSKKEFEKNQQIERQKYENHLGLDLVKETEQAVVPVGNGFPVEWAAYKDIYSPYIKSFPNICDVVYRNEYVVSLPNSMVSFLMKDSRGIFRLLKNSGFLLIRDRSLQTGQLILDYDGELSDVRLQLHDHFPPFNAKQMGNLVRLAINVNTQDLDQLKIEVAKPVKLRSLTWIKG